MKKFRIHLRHIGSGPPRRPGYNRGGYTGKLPYFWNIYLGGRLFLAIRPYDERKKTEFFDLSMGRAMLRYRREEEACPWPGADHYYGICGCVNKRPTHPRYLERGEGDVAPL